MPGLIDAHMHIDLIGHGEYAEYYEFLNGMERLDEVMPIAAKQTMRAWYSLSAGQPASKLVRDTRCFCEPHQPSSVQHLNVNVNFRRQWAVTSWTRTKIYPVEQRFFRSGSKVFVET